MAHEDFLLGRIAKPGVIFEMATGIGIQLNQHLQSLQDQQGFAALWSGLPPVADRTGASPGERDAGGMQGTYNNIGEVK